MKLRIALIAGAVLLAGCTDSDRQRRSAKMRDVPADVICRSYGELLFKGQSTGKVVYDEGGRVTFVDRATGRLTTIEGDCMIVYAKQ